MENIRLLLKAHDLMNHPSHSMHVNRCYCSYTCHKQYNRNNNNTMVVFIVT